MKATLVHEPYGGGHPEEVDQQEDHGTGHGSGGAVADHASLAGDFLVAHEDPDQVADADHKVAGGQEHDGPLRVLEPLGVNEERGQSHQRGEEAETGPQGDPNLQHDVFLQRMAVTKSPVTN